MFLSVNMFSIVTYTEAKPILKQSYLLGAKPWQNAVMTYFQLEHFSVIFIRTKNINKNAIAAILKLHVKSFGCFPRSQYVKCEAGAFVGSPADRNLGMIKSSCVIPVLAWLLCCVTHCSNSWIIFKSGGSIDFFSHGYTPDKPQGNSPWNADLWHMG